MPSSKPVRIKYTKKYASYSGFILRGSSPHPPQPYRGFEKPLGHGGPSGLRPSGPPCPRGFSNPLWASGDLGEDPLEKPEKLTHIIGAFWEIWLEIVLNTLFFGAFRVSSRIKITIDYRPKKSK